VNEFGTDLKGVRIVAQALVRLYADIVYAYSRGVLKGIADYSKIHRGWNFEFDDRREAQIDWVGAAGIIALFRRQDHIKQLMASRVPAVSIANHIHTDLATVIPDDAAIGKMAAEYFLGRGYRNFAYVGFNGRDYSSLRKTAYADRISESGLICSVFNHVDGEPTDPSLCERLLLLPRPLAVFCCNDNCARKVVNKIAERQVQVPDEIAVLGVDNDEINCELSGVQLSSVRIDTETIGFEAAALLAKLMAGTAAPRSPILIPPLEVITRRSTDALALDDEEVQFAVRYIRDCGGRDIGVEHILKRTRMSRRSIEMKFRKALGRSPYQEIRRVQEERLRLLLAGIDRPIKEIADACGYKEVRHVGDFAEKRLGLTRKQYRTKNEE
jgi:LacI family transcriptional regulator